MTETTRTIYLLRHGETEWNVARRIQGHLDSPLTARGRAQAHRMGVALRRELDDPAAWRLVASPLGRALTSAHIVAGVLGIDPALILTDDRLREGTTGANDGRLIDDAIRCGMVAAGGIHKGHFMLTSPSGESYADVAARLRSWLDDVADAPRLIVVSHGAAAKVLRGLWLGLSESEAAQLDAPQDALYRLTEGREERIACAPALDEAG